MKIQLLTEYGLVQKQGVIVEGLGHCFIGVSILVLVVEIKQELGVQTLED